MAETRAQSNKRIRQEALRDQLAQQKHIEKVVDNIGKMELLDFECKGEDGTVDYKALQGNKFKLDALKAANDQRLKLINKYLPDEKYVEITGEDGEDLIPKSIKIIYE